MVKGWGYAWQGWGLRNLDIRSYKVWIGTLTAVFFCRFYLIHPIYIFLLSFIFYNVSSQQLSIDGVAEIEPFMMVCLDPSKIFLIPLLVLTITVTYFSYTRSYSASHLYDTIAQTHSTLINNVNAYHRQPPTEEALFVAETLKEVPVNAHPIQLVCAEKEWTPGLVFTCNNPVGGLGNLRNSILTCVRFAIEAGASFVMPHIIVRNPNDIYEIRTGKRKPLSHMFDEATFVDSMREFCPQMTMYETVEDIPNYKTSYAPLPLLPEDLPKPADQVPKTGLEHPEEWRGHFDAWIAQYVTVTEENPVIIDLQRSYLQYPVYYDGEDFVQAFGRMLQFRRDTRDIAGTVLYAMNQQFKLNIKDPAKGIYDNAYLGVHLRTEEDSQKAWPGWGFGNLDAQAKLYLDHGAKFNTTLIYVASGDRGEIDKFAVMAKNRLGATTTTKFDLLREYQIQRNAKIPGKTNYTAPDCGKSPLETLEALTWDQQAQVDFLVMLKSSQFVGVGHSSFAWNVALRRRRYSQQKEGYLDGPYLLSDDLSQVAGKPREWPEYASCMWP